MMAPRARNNRQAPGEPQLSPVWTETRPLLTPALMARLCAYGSAETVCAGDLIYQLGDCSYDLILMNCIRLDGRYAKACVLIRMFNPETPVIFITDSHQMSDEDTAKVEAQGVFSTADPNFVEDLRDRVRELVGRDALIVKRNYI